MMFNELQFAVVCILLSVVTVYTGLDLEELLWTIIVKYVLLDC